MKKKYLIISISILLVLTTCLYVFISDNNEKVVISSEENNKNILNTNALTMMYETGYQSGEYQVSSDTSWPQNGYIFNETLSRCENGGTLTWNSETNKVVMQTNSSDRCYVYFDKEPSLAEVCSGKTFAECITTEVYTTDGDNGLYYHDADLANGAQDNSYRYSGANPNNYVCFGSDAATCPSDSLYRIIGVFENEVKLIKNTSYGNYAWDSGGSNTWNSSTKPDIRNTLNTTFLNTLSSTWQNKIASHTWYVGGNSVVKVTPKTFYNVEVVSGLMYVSDYGFAASPDYWTTSMISYSNASSSNWMHMGASEWTISRNSMDPFNVFMVGSAGGVDNAISNVSDTNAVRPSFYLGSFVLYNGGNGTIGNPYRITDKNIEITLSYNGTSKTYPAKQGMTWKEWFDYVDLTNIVGTGCLDGVCSAIFNDINYGFLAVNESNIVSDMVLQNQSGSIN